VLHRNSITTWCDGFIAALEATPRPRATAAWAV